MGRSSSIIKQKIEKNKRIAMREKLDRLTLDVVGTPHKQWDFVAPNSLEHVTRKTSFNDTIGVIEVSDEMREMRQVERPHPQEYLTSKIVKKWGKVYRGYYNGANLVRLEKNNIAKLT